MSKWDKFWDQNYELLKEASPWSSELDLQSELREMWVAENDGNSDSGGTASSDYESTNSSIRQKPRA